MSDSPWLLNKNSSNWEKWENSLRIYTHMVNLKRVIPDPDLYQEGVDQTYLELQNSYQQLTPSEKCLAGPLPKKYVPPKTIPVNSAMYS